MNNENNTNTNPLNQTPSQVSNPLNHENIKPKKGNLIVKVLAIFGGVIIAIIVLATAIISIVSATSNKLVCKSNKGSITIMYDDNDIKGYTATGMTYDLDSQKIIAKETGIKEYLNDFTIWFETKTSGTCTIEEK